MIDWQGSIIRGKDAERAWLARIEEARVYYFFAEAVEGLSRRRVRLLGLLVRMQQGSDGARTERAPVEQVWVYTRYRYYRVESVKVGPFEVAP